MTEFCTKWLLLYYIYSVRKPLAELPTPSPRIWCLIPIVWPRDNALLGVIRKTWGAHCDELRFVVGKQTFDTAKLGRSIDRSIIFVCVTEFFAYFCAIN